MPSRPLSQLQAHTQILPLTSIDYEGEWINVSLGGEKFDQRYIKPNLAFENPSGNAICLGNGLSRKESINIFVNCIENMSIDFSNRLELQQYS